MVEFSMSGFHMSQFFFFGTGNLCLTQYLEVLSFSIRAFYYTIESLISEILSLFFDDRGVRVSF